MTTLPDSLTYPKPPGQERPCPEPTKTGKIPFQIPDHDVEGETAFFIWGDLDTTDKVPLIGLHGGPGFPHNYISTLSLLFSDYGVPVILYDQIGCGESTLFPERMGDVSFWTPELFMAELDNLRKALGIKTFDLLGHSWGGMLASQYAATTEPVGLLRKLIICDCAASMESWSQSANKLLKALPVECQETLIRGDKEGKTDTPEYEAATNEFMKRFSTRLDPAPKELSESIEHLIKDSTVMSTMFGASDFLVTGSLKDWSMEGKLHKLTPDVVREILVVNGYFDVAQDECMLPFFREPTAKVKWVRFGLSSHGPQLEETEKFIKAVGTFLVD